MRTSNSLRPVKIYEVCKLSNETGNVAPELATLRRRDLEKRMNEKNSAPTGMFCALDPHPPVRLTRHRWYESTRSPKKYLITILTPEIERSHPKTLG
ncbi:hypothetical protein NQ318_012696 [Aromia moschata]|uniref:Uncharacterized protein n=1 Tax=Aromia moschata TaxID=1265417 RepID=A0AAV8YHK1_9CUCU|nr:hypothetical protein NQ318_012696 [Aromia moschata]